MISSRNTHVVFSRSTGDSILGACAYMYLLRAPISLKSSLDALETFLRAGMKLSRASSTLSAEALEIVEDAFKSVDDAREMLEMDSVCSKRRPSRDKKNATHSPAAKAA